MRTAKAEVESLLKALPEDCSLEDVQYHPYILEKVTAVQDRADAEGTLTHEDVTARMSKWLAE
ncbi:hypothetical protein [Candidatus Thiodictyon syntrophicum]|jgi:hypothetical protein|uniref:Uncharacterized protein n=1 Tax=Candidatus Thiodictyon syntrophicum TaxID=1166950 RepID=A0A2K8UFZ0_9GAMM|nr:hypothetical protein [Candidatus Thiodictyon syntrophicum]AUB84513.1 hypothetical protein THSYN_28675 [Candidatus Thiodictyon syntrophicum]